MKYGTMNYIHSNEGILMLRKVERKDDPNSGYCTLPGGKLESSEKGLKNIDGRINSAIRETFDETGIKIINPILIATILFDNKDRTFPNWKNPDNFLVNIFYSNKYEGKLKESDEGIPFWAENWGKILFLPSNPGDKKMYEWLRSGKNFFGVIKHKGNEIDEDETWVDYIPLKNNCLYDFDNTFNFG